MAANAYADDLSFLKKHTRIVELSAGGGARVAIAPDLQGRIMTSTIGASGMSFGWVNRGLIEAGKDVPSFNNYGGEDRFWLGPEAGQFALWFKKGQPFETGNWRTPKGFNSGQFSVTSQGRKSIALATQFDVVNYSGTKLSCAVQRTISTLGADHLSDCLGATLPAGVTMVAVESVNTVANAGKSPWTREGGLVSIWILGQFKPLPRGKVIAPFVPGDDAALGPKATTDYFGPLGADRCLIADDYLLFTCDGQYRSKIGIAPARSRPTLGSYDPDAKVLTIVQFNLPVGAAKLPYVNSLWKIQDKPFAGDAVNSYNDGPEKPGAKSLGGFYELETSSPAAELPKGGTITHIHRTFHFAGDVEALNTIAMKALGVDLANVI